MCIFLLRKCTIIYFVDEVDFFPLSGENLITTLNSKLMKKITLICFVLLFSSNFSVFAQRQMEKLDRGLVAVRTSSSSVFLSWRLLGNDPDSIGFNLYRDGIKINSTPITTATNYTDNSSSTASVYTVKPVIHNLETGETNDASVWTNNYLNIPLNVPAPMTMPDNSVCTYSPNDCSVGDVDGDGQYEIIVKWDPSNSKDNSQSGYTGDVYIDAYKLNGTQLFRIDLGKNIRAGAHYTQFMVADFDGDGKAEIACKTAPGTKDGLGNFLSKGPAASDNDAADYRNSGGYILTGPEYLTVFSGLTGAELATANYNPPRGTVSSWGDNYGNRVDRFLAAVAYLDGVHPSIIMCRGYYTRAVVAAWDFKNGNLTQRWTYDSGNTSGVGAYGQGNHNLSVGDVDDDGKDEIIYGASAFDDNGTLMYRTGYGHGDAMHLSDLDPDRKGLEVWEVHEDTNQPYGYEMHDARTGKVIWGGPITSDNGRGLAANVDGSVRGFEMWSALNSAVTSCKGKPVSTSKVSMNFRIYWDADLEDELLDGTSITKYKVGTLFTAADCSSNNSTKSTPCLSADIFGDWREEVIFRTSDNKNLRIYTTTIPTNNKLYTLMHDAQYRNSIAWQNTAYNQPPHCGFYVGDDMDPEPVSAIYNGEKRWTGGTIWDNNTSTAWTDSLGASSTFKNGDKVLFDITSGANATINIIGNLQPERMKVNSPYNVTLSGSGTLNGTMDLKKIGAGSLTLNNTNNFTGTTMIWDGDFYNNGYLANSSVSIFSFVKLGGNGIFGNDVSLGINSSIDPGTAAGTVSKLSFLKNLTDIGAVSYNFDVLIHPNQIVTNDTLAIGGNWTINNQSSFNFNINGGTVPFGDYVIAQCDGTISGDLNNIKVTGLPISCSYSLVIQNKNLILHLQAPSKLIWNGIIDSKWDNNLTSNWLADNASRLFLSNDSVLFNDIAINKSIIINTNLQPALVTVDANSTYTFNGSGSITGSTNVIKNGTGNLIISNSNNYNGITFINNGSIELNTISNGGVASPIGAATNAPGNIQLNGGKLNYTGVSASTDRGFTLGQHDGTIAVNNIATTFTLSGKITGAGKLIKDGPGRIALSTANDYAGGTLIKGGSIILTSDAANISALGSDTITFQNGSLIMFDSNTTSNTSNWNLNIPSGFSGNLNVDGMSTLTGSIVGDGILNYFTNFTGNILSSDVSNYNGTINVTTDATGGNFVVYNDKGYGKSKINLNNNVTMMYRLTKNITLPIGDLTGNINSVLGAGGTGSCTITWEIGARNANSTFNGLITNAQYSSSGAVAAIHKVGSGIWTLTNANTYSGGTTIDGGTLLVNNTSGSGTGSGNVIVNANGSLIGSGIISGNVTVNSGGMLSAGNGIGSMTLGNVNIQNGGSLFVDLNKSNSTNDVLNITGTLTMNGTLQINKIDDSAFAIGDSIKFINGLISGVPSTIIPASPGAGLAWDLSEFTSLGVIKVKTITALSSPQITSKIYPNPCKNWLKIDLSTPAEKAYITVYNLIGEKVIFRTFNQNSQVTLNIGTLPRGIYILQIDIDNQSITKKFIKE